jgi:general secretion pathway protein F/type IV pilus assembly protein PilC
MPTFDYTARRLDGSNIRGQLDAATRRDAISFLAQRSLYPLQLADRKTGARGWQRFRRGRVSTEHIANALTQLSDLLRNGVPLLESLKLLSDQSSSTALREVMQQVHERVAEGESLDQAVARHPKVFSDLTISMIRAGSEGAFLEEALTRVARFLELQEELKSRVKGAMVYPLILMTVGTIVTLALVIFFVPKFEGLFHRLESQGTGLPVATKMLLASSHFLMSYGLLLGLSFIPIVIGAVRLLGSSAGRKWSDRVKLRLPLAGAIFHNTAVSRFCRVLGTLLRNGVPILKALQISSGSVGNQLLAKAILDSVDNVSAGQTLSVPLAHCGLIPAPTMAMIRIAEESNTLDTVLVGIADVIDRKVEKQLALMVRFVEPVMLVVIGIAILFVMVALLLPIIEASTTI